MFNNALFLKVRYPVLLTPAEKHMARGVCHAFRQAVILFTFDSYTCFFLPAYMQESFPLHLAGIYYIIVSVVSPCYVEVCDPFSPLLIAHVRRKLRA